MNPALVDRIIVLVQVIVILGGVAVFVRLVDLAIAQVGRRQARRRLQRGVRLAERRHTWAEIDEIEQTTLHDSHRVW